MGRRYSRTFQIESLVMPLVIKYNATTIQTVDGKAAPTPSVAMASPKKIRSHANLSNRLPTVNKTDGNTTVPLLLEVHN